MFVHRLKLRAPELAATWIDRATVERRVAGSPVVAVVAGPGYGKTVLAARSYHQHAGPKLWYGLDAGDADVAVFAAHLSAAIALLEGANTAAAEWRPGSAREVGSRFAEMLGEHAPLIVFDDVHALEGSPSAAVLAEFVERSLRAGARFVVTGRALPRELLAIAPRLPLATVGAADLSFDDAAALRFFADDDARAAATRAELVRRAEGWPAGLMLLANAPASRTGTPMSSSDDETRSMLFSYLATEALENLSERERTFLLETSILDELQVGVCDAVSGGDDAREILPSLTQRGLFVVRRGDDAFTAHQLFREFLREQLIRTQSRSFVAELHRRAAVALAAEGDNVAEIAHLLDAGETEAAAQRLELVAFGLIATGQLARIAALISRVPHARTEASPTLLTALGRVEQLRGDWDRALATLGRAIDGARAANEPDTMAEAVRVASTILASRGASEHLRRLLDETLARDDLSDASRTALSMTLGALHLEHGRFDEALATFDAIMPALIARGDLGLQGMVLHNTGCAHARRGEPFAAIAMYDRALRVKRSAGQRVSTLLTLGNKIFMLRVIGDIDEAERLTRVMLDEAYDIGNAAMIANAHENEGALLLARGDAEAALRAFRAGQDASDPADVTYLPEILHGLAQTHVALGQCVEADGLCRNVAATLRETERFQTLAPILLTRATCAAAFGEPERAFELIREALDLADAGTDTVAAAVTRIDAGAALLRLVTALPAARAHEARTLAEKAAAEAFALVHERDYRFLLRTRTAEMALLRERLAARAGAGPPAEAATVGLRIELLGGFRLFHRRRLAARDDLETPAGPRPVRLSRDGARTAGAAGASDRHVLARGRCRLRRGNAARDDQLRAQSARQRRAVRGGRIPFVAPPGTTIDVLVFEECLERARAARSAGDDEAARNAYIEAIALYGGDFLDGYDDGDWQWRERERLRADATEALRRLVHRSRQRAAPCAGSPSTGCSNSRPTTSRPCARAYTLSSTKARGRCGTRIRRLAPALSQRRRQRTARCLARARVNPGPLVRRLSHTVT